MRLEVAMFGIAVNRLTRWVCEELGVSEDLAKGIGIGAGIVTAIVTLDAISAVDAGLQLTDVTVNTGLVEATWHAVDGAASSS